MKDKKLKTQVNPSQQLTLDELAQKLADLFLMQIDAKHTKPKGSPKNTIATPANKAPP